MEFLEPIHQIAVFTSPNYLFQAKSKTKNNNRQEQKMCFGNSNPELPEHFCIFLSWRSVKCVTQQVRTQAWLHTKG